jgi:hypothetical protein
MEKNEKLECSNLPGIIAGVPANGKVDFENGCLIKILLHN